MDHPVAKQLTTLCRQVVRKCVRRTTHSYVFDRIAFSPISIILMTSLFIPLAVSAFEEGGFSGELLAVLASAGLICGGLTFAYLTKYRTTNAVRIYTTAYGFVYKDRVAFMRVPRRSIHLVEASPKEVRVITERGVVTFTHYLVNGFVIRKTIERWLADDAMDSPGPNR